ncbi:MAG: type IV pilus twitching motility protein PilT [Oscillospiraceae bacterium]
MDTTYKSEYPQSIKELLIRAVEKGASDLHLVVARAPSLRISGALAQEDLPILTAEDIKDLIYPILNLEQQKKLETEWELDFSYAVVNYARFRGNIIFQRGTMAAVFRVVPFDVPMLEDLTVNPDISRLCTLPRGLVLVTGPTGSGKSTLLAGMIDKINRTREVNVITIEDPIEFLHVHKKAIIRQREVGADTHSFASALRQALRHDPDVIMIGEMRDYESIAIALTAAETGHLVFSTLHTQNAPLSINRIIDSFPAGSRDQIRQQVSGSLKAIISRQLIPSIDGKRVAADEYMVDTNAVRSMIREGNELQIYSAIQTGKEQYMQTMDQSLAELYNTGIITYENMIQHCINLKEVQRLTRNMF